MLWLTDADDWTLAFMEGQHHVFPESDAPAVAQKLHEVLKNDECKKRLAQQLAADKGEHVGVLDLAVRLSLCTAQP
jgi:hypothetical protein